MRKIILLLLAYKHASIIVKEIMDNIEEKLAESLTAESTELIPFLPYLLQDLWELGSSPTEIIDILSEQCHVQPNTRVLDLACGKGAVSVNIAKTFKCNVLGVDIMPDFITYAKNKAIENKVDNLCSFEVEDIGKTVDRVNNFNIVILGAVGDVLGNQKETLIKLIKTIKKGGFILIDDVYSRKTNKDSKYITKKKWKQIFDELNLILVTDKIANESDIKSTNDEQQALIKQRVEELKKKYIDKASLFDGYIASQLDECKELENDIDPVTLLLQKI